MFKCVNCNKEINNSYNYKNHSLKCDKLFSIKKDIINLYLNEKCSILEIRKKFNISYGDIKLVLLNSIRSLSEAVKIAHIKYPNKFKHSEKTKEILRIKRLEYLKNNTLETDWRSSNMPYPESLFLKYLETNNFQENYLIIREYSVFPYYIDFAFINEKVAVEIDGSQHLKLDVKIKDEKKDDLLRSLGWIVIRISENEIKQDIENCFNFILEILKKQSTFINNDTIRLGIIKEKSSKKLKHKDNFGFTKKEYEKFKKSRLCERPPYEVLKKMILELGYVKVGKIYNVSDNSIRKWVKFYEKTNFI
jgi:very-short-patch-repair endonuclease